MLTNRYGAQKAAQRSSGVNVTAILEEIEMVVNQLLHAASKRLDVGNLPERRERLEGLIEDSFTREITVMFTEFTGTTSGADIEGGSACPLFTTKRHDVVVPIIEAGRGVLVKTMSDGTMSYFADAADAVRTSVHIQRVFADLNLVENRAMPVALRIGMNTGKGLVEKHDVFGDVVNIASRFESLARPAEILISEETYNALADKDEFSCWHVQTTRLSGKKGACKVFKVFWKRT